VVAEIRTMTSYNLSWSMWWGLKSCRNYSSSNKAVVDYTSPVLCTPITPFPPIGNVVYRQHAGEGPSHDMVAQKIGKDCACGSGDILSETQTERQTHRQMHSSQYFATAHAGEVITGFSFLCFLCCL